MMPKVLRSLAVNLPGQAFGRSGKHREVVLIALTEIVHTAAHMSHDAETKSLRLLAAVVLARKSSEAFRQNR